MPEFFAQIEWPLSIGLLLSLPMEIVSGGKPQRPLHHWGVHIALLTLTFCAELFVFRRPWFACSQMLVLQGVVLAVSAVKMNTMREPFVFQDFEYFIDMLRHPRLYFPFFGLGKLCLILGGVGAMIYTSTLLEPNLAASVGWLAFVAGWLLLTATALSLLWFSTRPAFPTSFEPQTDMKALGLSTSLAAYAVAENKPMALPDRFTELALPVPQSLPHIVAVQSESFFDARRMWPQISDEVFGWLDDIKQDSLQYGLLEVPAVGANTVRTEFAFLSGLRKEALGVHRFNPYRKLPAQGVHTIAHRLRTAGYRTICVHPYTAKFYGRNKVYPLLGFDEFIDVGAFGAHDKAGPFIGDPAVAAKVSELLANERHKPLFVFVITMENHGPLHLENVGEAEASRLYQQMPPEGFNDLSVYLRHIGNAGIMLKKLRASLSLQNRPGCLCWYGDHVPIMPGIYAHTKFDDPRTDYFIWHSSADEKRLADPRNIAASDLAMHLLCTSHYRDSVMVENSPLQVL
jgi:hypothetical protein